MSMIHLNRIAMNGFILVCSFFRLQAVQSRSGLDLTRRCAPFVSAALSGFVRPARAFPDLSDDMLLAVEDNFDETHSESRFLVISRFNN